MYYGKPLVPLKVNGKDKIMGFMKPVAHNFSHQEALEYTFEGDREIYCVEDSPEPNAS